MATTTREALGLPKPGESSGDEGGKVHPLEKARQVVVAAANALEDLLDQERALQSKRTVLGNELAREGKLTRTQRAELASVNRQLKQLSTPIKRAQAKLQRASNARDKVLAKVEARQAKQREKEREREQRANDRKKAVNQARLDKRIAAIEAKSLKKAGTFVELPQGAKPSKGTSKDRPHMQCGYLTKEGRGKSARWVLMVTDSYGMAVLPVKVTGQLQLPKKESHITIPNEALKAIDKTGAFRLTKNGGIQPIKVRTTESRYLREPEPANNGYTTTWDPTQASGSAKEYALEDVGTAYMIPEQSRVTNVHGMMQVIPKEPTKVNALEWALSPALLKQFAEALGSGSGDMGSIVVTLDLKQVGKASDGRQVLKSVRIQRYDSNTRRPVDDGAVAVVMPVKLAPRRK